MDNDGLNTCFIDHPLRAMLLHLIMSKRIVLEK
jgi:hypothetical protein